MTGPGRLRPGLADHPAALRCLNRLRRARQTCPPGERTAPARRALEKAARAAHADPTLPLTWEGERGIDLLYVLTRDLARAFENERRGDAGPSGQAGADPHGEVESLVERTTAAALKLAALARSDWDTPAHRSAVARDRLPSRRVLVEITEGLHRSVAVSAALDPDLDEVRALQDLADGIARVIR
ncbi:hypothetical protein [Nocardiopsis flavescens]